MEFPKYEHKYLSVFDNNEDYEEQTAVIHECNWSAIRDPNQTEEDENDYYPSVRPTNEDNKYVMKWYSSDELKKKFALEITWGYYGFEWVDYEYNGEILKGGNLYTIKEITKVPTIVDGYRLQHINNFLNTQTKVTEIEWFDTSNIISAVNMLKIPKRNNQSVNRFNLHINNFPKLENADGMLYESLVTLKTDENIIYLPCVKNMNNFMKSSANYNNNGSYFDPNVNFKLNIGNELTTLANAFEGVNVKNIINNNEIDIAKIFFNNPYFPNVIDFSRAFRFRLTNGYGSSISVNNLIININLYDGDYVEDKIINCENILEFNNIKINGAFSINIIHNNKISLKNAFASVSNGLQNITFTDINKITSLNSAFYPSNLQIIPITHYIKGCDMKDMYMGAIFKDITNGFFDFSPNGDYITDPKEYYSINGTYPIDFEFKNVDKLPTIGFGYFKFEEPTFLDIIFTNEGDERGPRPAYLQQCNITGIPSQTLNVLIDNSNYTSIFHAMSNIDFTNTEVIINITHSIRSSQLTIFNNCTNMITSPIIKGELMINRSFSIFGNCANLKYINCEELDFDTYRKNDMPILSFAKSPELIDFKFGDFKGAGLNFTNCNNLNPVTFMETINRNLHNTYKAYNLTIMSKVHNQLSDADKEKLLIIFKEVYVVETVEEETTS